MPSVIRVDPPRRVLPPVVIAASILAAVLALTARLGVAGDAGDLFELELGLCVAASALGLATRLVDATSGRAVLMLLMSAASLLATSGALIELLAGAGRGFAFFGIVACLVAASLGASLATLADGLRLLAPLMRHARNW